MYLNDKEFLEVIERTPLISIDLVIRDLNNQIFMGYRLNNPAKGKWFVPGGRIYKNECLDDAFKRITLAEVGYALSRNDAAFIGLFTHEYDTNFLNVDNITTHYVVIAYKIQPPDDFEKYISSQHSKVGWFAQSDSSQSIHPNSLEYFNHLSQISNTQYSFLNARRDAFNNLIWQTPVLSLTAQAFLFTIILSCESGIPARLISAILSLITALASIQLLSKHREMEQYHARMLHDYEKKNGLYEVNRRLISVKTISNLVAISSYKIWLFVLLIFAVAALLIIVLTLILPSEKGLFCKLA